MKILFVKISILFMFVSGILLLDIFNVQWENFREILAVHTLLSIVLTVFFVIPFVNSHTYNYIVVKKINNKNGWFISILLLSVVLSGVYLFFFGNRGGDVLGVISFNIHLYGSILFVIFLLLHIKKKVSVNVVVATLALSIIYPVQSYSLDNKLTKLKIEQNKYHNRDWTNSSKCKSCHSEIFEQWADSNHRNLAESNPYYMVMEGLAAEIEGEDFRQWCMGCHNPSGLTTGLKKTGHAMNGNFLAERIFEKGAKSLESDFKKEGQVKLEEGVPCVACHRITKADSFGNASYTLELNNRKKYPFEDGHSQITQYLGEKFINSTPKVHKLSYSKPLYQKSAYCASCHDESSPITGKKIVSTFKEWEKSSYNNPKNSKEHKNCIDCHMTYLENGKFAPKSGVSTDGGVVKKM